MIDFHSHIIPEVDDGSRNIKQTDELLNEAVNAGFDKIIFTPHYIQGYYESNVESNKVWLDGIKKIIQKENLNLKVYLGNEGYLSDDIYQMILDKKITTINNSKYLLMEMPLNAKPINMFNVVYNLKENGIIPIIAHPERYKFIQEDPFIIYQLVSNGSLAQSNYGSFLGNYGERAEILVKKLLEANMIQFLGSDVHRPDTVYEQIQDAKLEIINIAGVKKYKEIVSTYPEHVLRNEDFEIEASEQLRFSFMEKRKMGMK